MNTFIEYTLSYFFDKEADELFSKVKQNMEYKNMRKEIQKYSEQYFKDCFYQIPLPKEFDFDGLNDFLHKNFLEKIIPCFYAPDYEQRLFFTEQLYRQSYEYAKATDSQKQNTVNVYIKNILNIMQKYFMKEIDNKYLLLANHTVNQIKKSLQNPLQQSQDKLEELITITTKNSEKEITKKIDNFINLYFLEKIIPSRFDSIIEKKIDFDIIQDYLDGNVIKKIISPNLTNILTIISNNSSITMNINLNEQYNYQQQDFVMALIKYIPSENYSGFYNSKYILEFDILNTQNIIAFQLEIKDDKQNKFIDKKIEVITPNTHINFPLSILTKTDIPWKNVSEICLTIFLNSDYIIEKNSYLCISNLKLSPSTL